jgi:sec-independent protein translocase protein TatC
MEEFNKKIEKFLPFLEDLRHRLYRGVILFVVFLVGGFLSAGIILKKVLSLVQVDEVIIATSSPFQFANVAMDVGFFIALMVSVPYIIYSFYAFIVPALTRSEKIKLLTSIPVSIGLFIMGFFYGFSILYYAIGLLASINVNMGINNIWDISQFLSQMFITAALLGFVFEFPLLLTLMVKIGIMDQQTLKNKRRIAYFLIFCLTSLLPPTDGISLIAMALPLVLLYEVTILLNNKKDYVWIRD